MVKSLHLEIKIPDELHGLRLDAAASKLLPDYSRSKLTQWIKTQQLMLNQQVYKPSDKVAAGDTITLQTEILEIDPDFKSSKAEAIPLMIVYEDADILVLNKQAGLVVHPGAGNPQHTLVNALLHHHPEQAHLPRAGIIHRLDKETTGLMIVAKSLEAHTKLIRQMQAREIHRYYLTLVQGQIIAGDTIQTAFGRHPRQRLKMSVRPQGVEAVTHYTVEKRYQHFTLLQVKLETGRTHQIRVHMEHIHHPVIGDPLYGKIIPRLKELPEDLQHQLSQYQRQALHAWKLEFLHPCTQEQLTLTADLPQDLKELLRVLDKDDNETTLR